MMTAKMSDKDTREDIQKVFNLFDDDQTGRITLRNLKHVTKEWQTMSDAELMEMIGQRRPGPGRRDLAGRVPTAS